MARGNDNLVDSKDPARWQAALDSYPERVKQHAQTGKRRKSLVSLDEFVRTHLPVVIKARYSDASDDKGYLKKEDRGKFRPLMRYANALDPQVVEKTTREAFTQAASDMSSAMETLTSLKGVGPATASAILSFGSLDGDCPFLSDEAMQAFGLTNKAGKLDYTLSNWKSLRTLCDDKAKQLNKFTVDQDSAEWNAVLVERAIWAESVEV
ncbi:hypothetical protein EMMF5_004566 [Cystobasidiomycetes sp. EMM_F5]